ncbi:MAG: alpha/beta hydrolase [Campylobacteraceae bacterium]|nr:alpha/beta hydrolase [Campylobacteraceae bacterium]
MAIKTIIHNGISYDISYEIINPKAQKDALILHGWGANKNIMKNAFNNLLNEYRLVFIDLPGFGNSSLHEPMDSYEYAKLLGEFISTCKFTPHFIAGHSFGGKIATLLKPKNLVLLSSAGIVAQKSLKVRAKIKIFKLLKALGLGGFYKFFATSDVDGMSKKMYETLKKVVDEDMSDEFSSYGGKALIFWGKEDRATPLSSGEKIAKLIKNSSFYPLNGDHFFFAHHAQFIAKKIGEEL